MNIKLHDYQKVALNKILPALKKFARALVVMATGLGKTIVSLFVVRHFMTKSSRVLFVCHDSGILSDVKKKYVSFFGANYTYAEFYGQKKNWDADKHHFVFATFQSLNSHLFKSDRKNIFSPEHFDYIVVDESHHSKAETFDNVINYFEPKWKLGITATPDREDEEDIRQIFGKEVVNYPLAMALDKGWLTKVVYKIMSDGFDQETIDALVQEVLVENVRMTEKQLNERLFIRKRTEEQVKIIVEETQDGRKALVFCNNIPHLLHVQNLMPSSVGLHSDQTFDENVEAMESFNGGRAQRMLAVDKFNEGRDVPDIDLLSFLRGTGSKRIWEQQLGRGLRKFPGKEWVTVLDFVGNLQRVRDIKNLITQIREFGGSSKKNLNDELVLNEALHIDGDYFTFDFASEIVNLFKVMDHLDRWSWPTIDNLRLEVSSYFGKDVKFTGNQYDNANKENWPHHSRFPDIYGLTFQELFFGKKRRNKTKWLSEVALYEAVHSHFKQRSFSPLDYKAARQDDWPDRLSFQRHYKKTFTQVLLKDKPVESKRSNPRSFNYSLCSEASKAAILLGITSRKKYEKLYHKDVRLPSRPQSYYTDFVSWKKFLNKE
jgi:superfamily II DNA or RNA helicase